MATEPILSKAASKLTSKQKKERPTTKEVSPIRPKKLMRSEQDRIIAGVAGGLGEYLELDSGVIRLIFVVMTLFGGSGLVIYVVMWLILPSASDKKLVPERLPDPLPFSKTHGSHSGSSSFWALIFIGIGGYFLLKNFGWLTYLHIDRYWPVLLIGLGVFLLVRR